MIIHLAGAIAYMPMLSISIYERLLCLNYASRNLII